MTIMSTVKLMEQLSHDHCSGKAPQYHSIFPGEYLQSFVWINSLPSKLALHVVSKRRVVDFERRKFEDEVPVENRHPE